MGQKLIKASYILFLAVAVIAFGLLTINKQVKASMLMEWAYLCVVFLVFVYTIIALKK